MISSFAKIFAESPHEWQNRYSGKRICYFTSYTYVINAFNTQTHYKQSSIADFSIVAKHVIFWITIVTSTHWNFGFTQKLGTACVTSFSALRVRVDVKLIITS